MDTDLAADFSRAMVQEIPTQGPAEKAAFAALGVTEQAWRFINWQSRLVHAHPRRVLRADGLDAALASHPRRTEVEALLGRLASGGDVGPHLSRGIGEGYCLHPLRKDGPDFDLMLNEWAIHHLHLSSKPTADGFNERGSELLFAVILPEAAYAVAVGTHADWTAPRLVKEIVKSWPSERFFIRLNVLGGTPFTPKEHAALRKAGMATPATVDDGIYICRLTLGLTTALVSVAMSREAARTLRAVGRVDRDPSHALSQLKLQAASAGLPWPSRPSLGLAWGSAPTRWGFGFVERESGATLLI